MKTQLTDRITPDNFRIVCADCMKVVTVHRQFWNDHGYPRAIVLFECHELRAVELYDRQTLYVTAIKKHQNDPTDKITLLSEHLPDCDVDAHLDGWRRLQHDAIEWKHRHPEDDNVDQVMVDIARRLDAFEEMSNMLDPDLPGIETADEGC
jgi:hypothetical protein